MLLSYFAPWEEAAEDLSVTNGAADRDVLTFVLYLSVLSYLVWYKDINCSEGGSFSIRNVGIYLSAYKAVFALGLCSEDDWFESRTGHWLC